MIKISIGQAGKSISALGWLECEGCKLQTTRCHTSGRDENEAKESVAQYLLSQYLISGWSVQYKPGHPFIMTAPTVCPNCKGKTTAAPIQGRLF